MFDVDCFGPGVLHELGVDVPEGHSEKAKVSFNLLKANGSFSFSCMCEECAKAGFWAAVLEGWEVRINLLSNQSPEQIKDKVMTLGQLGTMVHTFATDSLKARFSSMPEEVLIFAWFDDFYEIVKNLVAMYPGFELVNNEINGMAKLCVMFEIYHKASGLSTTVHIYPEDILEEAANV
jgi:hypothetical protein